MGMAIPPLIMSVSVGVTIKLPDDFSTVPYIDEYAEEINVSSIQNGTGMPAFAANLRRGVPDEAWLHHVYNVVTEKDGKKTKYQ